jgi:hypothetical protein
MVNVSELLINAVKNDKPKTLTGLSQRGNVVGQPSGVLGCADIKTTGGEAEPNPLLLLMWNAVSPYLQPVRASRP